MPDDDRAGTSDDASTERLRELVGRLLVPDRREHEAAIEALAGEGDERVVPHLVEVATLHAVATDWETFGFPEVLREHPPPRSLTHPEVRWPGAVDALNAVAEPTYDSRAAWLRWESWMTREGVDPLDGFSAWKARLYRTFLPLVGQFLDAEGLDPATVRWGNTDPASLHPLNGPQFGRSGEHLRDEDPVFGFRVEGRAVAVPRYLLFPHELLNARIAGRPIAVTYCTMCNSPICYDRGIDGDALAGTGDAGGLDGPTGPETVGQADLFLRENRSRDGSRAALTFGSTGLIRQGNKLMYDEETRTLWSQHRGVPVAGPLSGTGTSLSMRPVTRTEWSGWQADNPDTLVLSPETGYDYDYGFYRDYEGFVRRHYWENESVTHPGVAPADSRTGSGADAVDSQTGAEEGDPTGGGERRGTESADRDLDDKTDVYGVEVDGAVRVYPLNAIEAEGVILDSFGDRSIAVTAVGGDVAAFEAPPGPLAVEGEGRLRDGEGDRWRVTREGLVHAEDEVRLPRIPGRHGLWLAFRVGYENPTLVAVE